jgi:uncharacterized surface protein with fasciclin (FAS1) repeats
MTAVKALTFGSVIALSLVVISPATYAHSGNYKSSSKSHACQALEKTELKAWARFDQDSAWRVQNVQNKIYLQDKLKCQPTGTVVSQLAERTEFSILVEAVTRAGLVDTLNGLNDYTVFAPTNEAFAEALAKLGLSKDQLLNSPDLANILTYHVVPQFIKSSDALKADGANLPTLSGSNTIGVDVTAKGLFLNSKNNPSKVVVTDLDGSNGIVHAIDTVLLP